MGRNTRIRSLSSKLSSTKIVGLFDSGINYPIRLIHKLTNLFPAILQQKACIADLPVLNEQYKTYIKFGLLQDPVE